MGCCPLFMIFQSFYCECWFPLVICFSASLPQPHFLSLVTHVALSLFYFCCVGLVLFYMLSFLCAFSTGLPLAVIPLHPSPLRVVPFHPLPLFTLWLLYHLCFFDALWFRCCEFFSTCLMLPVSLPHPIQPFRWLVCRLDQCSCWRYSMVSFVSPQWLC